MENERQTFNHPSSGPSGFPTGNRPHNTSILCRYQTDVPNSLKHVFFAPYLLFLNFAHVFVMTDVVRL